MTKSMRLWVVAALAGLVGLAIAAGAQEDETYVMDPKLAHRAESLILARCSICHTPDLIYQQRLPETRWGATVEKMVQWGAQLSTDEAEVLIKYLSLRYYPGALDSTALDTGFRTWEPVKPEPAGDDPIPGVAAKGSGKYSHNCQACHGEKAAGGIGPKLMRNGILKNEGAFWEVVLYGRGAMPAWAGLLGDQDIADIHAWLKTLSAERDAE
jgi:cytochrome c oxidase cbb3-type subunit 3